MPPRLDKEWWEMKKAHPEVKIQRRRDTKKTFMIHDHKMVRKVFFSKDPKIVNALDKVWRFLQDRYLPTRGLRIFGFEEIKEEWKNDARINDSIFTVSQTEEERLFHIVFPAAYDLLVGYCAYYPIIKKGEEGEELEEEEEEEEEQEEEQKNREK